MANTDLARIRKKCIESLYLCGDNVLKHMDGIEKTTEVDRLKSYLNGYCVLEQVQTLEDLESRINFQKNGETYSLDEIKAMVNETCTKLNQRNHPLMKTFLDKVCRSQQEESQSLNSSQDVLLTCDQQTYTDPITKRPIREAVRNTCCGHYYERDTIYQVIQQSVLKRKILRCPYIGCRNSAPLTAEDLVFDEELTDRLAQQDPLSI